MISTRNIVAVSAAVAFVFVGCGAPTASVSGSVSYRGSPVKSGVVVFVDSVGRATLPATVRPDGSFEIKTAAVGPARVSYDNLKPPPLTEQTKPRNWHNNKRLMHSKSKTKKHLNKRMSTLLT